MRYLYVDFAIHSPIAFELARWMNEIKYTKRTKASKLFRLVIKYENMYKRPQRGYNETPRTGLNAMRPFIHQRAK